MNLPEKILNQGKRKSKEGITYYGLMLKKNPFQK
jgi:hypothetical protein